MRYIVVLFSVIMFGCSKNDNSLPDPGAPVAVSGSETHTVFNFSGNMLVDKYDSNGTAITNYTLTNSYSNLTGTEPNYQLSTDINASALKGETTNSISVNIPNDYMSSIGSGTGIFVGGIITGFYNGDSLYYRVLYKDFDNNNIFLDYQGQLTDSH